MQTAQRRDFFLLAIVPLLAFAAYARFHGGEPLVTTDSPGYMYFGEDRTAGYPLFLAAVKLLFGHFETARYVQLGALCGSLMLLAFSFRAVTGLLWAALAFEILLFANPGLPLLAGQMMADCLAAACIALFAAIVLPMMKGPRPWMIWSLAAVTAAAILIRPVSIALVPAALAAIAVFGGGMKMPRWAQALILIAAVLCAYKTTPVVHWLRHEPVIANSPLARGLLQKTLFRQWPASAEADACDGGLIAKDTAGPDAYLAQAPADIRPHLMRPYSGYLRFMVIMPEMAALHNAARFSELDPILMCYDMARIKSDPLYFAEDAGRQFVDLLTYSTFVSPRLHDAIDGYIAAHPPVIPAAIPRRDADYQLRARAIDELHLPPDIFAASDLHIKAPNARPFLLAFGLRVFQIAGAIAMAFGVVSLPAWVAARRPAAKFYPWFAIGVLGIAFYGMMAITAIVEIALPRYVFPLWPLFCASLMLAAMTALPQKRAAPNPALRD